MALSVRLIDGATTYRLKCEIVTHVIERTPMQIILPGVDPVLNDLGFFKPEFILEGIIDDTPSSEGGQPIPSKFELEDIAISNYLDTIQVQTTNATDNSTDTYTCKILKLRFEQTAATETRWKYQMVVASQGRVHAA